ncbi:hypothetical protein [Pseudopedobacter beijingensis]|uniref:Uncharacterized protein n=1 Tax=Pseudopedobacter beijingensis TaxID=1207056 RepID=A0ABW4IGV2_9SPHI
MLWVKKLFRLLILSSLITLSTLGIGLTGGIPIPINKRRENLMEVKIEVLTDETTNDNEEDDKDEDKT